MPVHQNSFRRKKRLKFLTLHLQFWLLLIKIIQLNCHPEYHQMRFKMVHSNTKKARIRVCQSQVCYLHTTYSSLLSFSPNVSFRAKMLVLIDVKQLCRETNNYSKISIFLNLKDTVFSCTVYSIYRGSFTTLTFIKKDIFLLICGLWKQLFHKIALLP